MNISCVSGSDASDIKSGLGTDYYMPKAMIAQSASLSYISKLEKRNWFFTRVKSILKKEGQIRKNSAITNKCLQVASIPGRLLHSRACFSLLATR
jgi:hypothetical protein